MKSPGPERARAGTIESKNAHSLKYARCRRPSRTTERTVSRALASATMPLWLRCRHSLRVPQPGAWRMRSVQGFPVQLAAFKAPSGKEPATALCDDVVRRELRADSPAGSCVACVVLAFPTCSFIYFYVRYVIYDMLICLHYIVHTMYHILYCSIALPAGLTGQHSLRGSRPQRHSDACGPDGAAPSESQPMRPKIERHVPYETRVRPKSNVLVGASSILLLHSSSSSKTRITTTRLQASGLLFRV